MISVIVSLARSYKPIPGRIWTEVAAVKTAIEVIVNTVPSSFGGWLRSQDSGSRARDFLLLKEKLHRRSTPTFYLHCSLDIPLQFTRFCGTGSCKQTGQIAIGVGLGRGIGFRRWSEAVITCHNRGETWSCRLGDLPWGRKRSTCLGYK